MSRSPKSRHSRLLAAAVTILLSGAAVAAATASAQAAPVSQLGHTATVRFHHDIVTVAHPGTQITRVNTRFKEELLVIRGATNNRAAYPLRYTATGLPRGLFILHQGVILGTPTKAGTYRVTVTATDTTGAAGRTSFIWFVTGGDTVTIANPGTQTTPVNAPEVIALRGHTNNQSAYPLSYTATGLPPGLSVNDTAGDPTIDGHATEEGTYRVTVTATDTTGATGKTSFSWHVTGSDTVTIANPGTQTTPVNSPATSVTIHGTTNNEAAYPLAYTATGLPPGLAITLEKTGVVGGTPTKAGTYDVTATATDVNGAAASTSFTWTVTGGSSTATDLVAVVNPGTQTTPVNSPATSVTIHGTTDNPAAAPLGYSATGLPPGLSIFSGTGVISGSPTKAGTYNVTVTATDTTGAAAQTSFTWTVTSAPSQTAQ